MSKTRADRPTQAGTRPIKRCNRSGRAGARTLERVNRRARVVADLRPEATVIPTVSPVGHIDSPAWTIESTARTTGSTARRTESTAGRSGSTARQQNAPERKELQSESVIEAPARLTEQLVGSPKQPERRGRRSPRRKFSTGGTTASTAVVPRKSERRPASPALAKLELEGRERATDAAALQLAAQTIRQASSHVASEACEGAPVEAPESLAVRALATEAREVRSVARAIESDAMPEGVAPEHFASTPEARETARVTDEPAPGTARHETADDEHTGRLEAPARVSVYSRTLTRTYATRTRQLPPDSDRSESNPWVVHSVLEHQDTERDDVNELRTDRSR